MSLILARAPEWLACTGKGRFSSASVAARVAKRMNRAKRHRTKARTRPLGSYRCQHSGFFHIGGEGRT